MLPGDWRRVGATAYCRLCRPLLQSGSLRIPSAHARLVRARTRGLLPLGHGALPRGRTDTAARCQRQMTTCAVGVEALEQVLDAGRALAKIEHVSQKFLDMARASTDRPRPLRVIHTHQGRTNNLLNELLPLLT